MSVEILYCYFIYCFKVFVFLDLVLDGFGARESRVLEMKVPCSTSTCY